MPLIATMPALPIGANYTVEWVAIDPTSGADVSGVTITNPALYGVDLSGNVGETHAAPVEPLWIDLPNNLFAPAPAAKAKP